MGMLDEVLEKFKNDKSWNTENKDGSHRFDKKISWIEEMVKEYASFFEVSEDEIIQKMEKGRTYSWPNFYQEANFPSVSAFGDLVGVYKTFEEFNEQSINKWKGFRCPKCKNIGRHPQLCEHRLNKDGICDWTANGLFSGPKRVIILEGGFDTIPIFEPVDKESEGA